MIYGNSKIRFFQNTTDTHPVVADYRMNVKRNWQTHQTALIMNNDRSCPMPSAICCRVESLVDRTSGYCHGRDTSLTTVMTAAWCAGDTQTATDRHPRPAPQTTGTAPQMELECNVSPRRVSLKLRESVRVDTGWSTTALSHSPASNYN